MRRHLRALAPLALLLVAELTALRALLWAGRVERWRVDLPNFWRWLGQAPPGDVAAGLLRWLAIAVAVWLVATTALYLLAHMLRVRVLVALVGRFTLSGVRRAVERAVVAGTVTISVAAGPTAAFAHTAPPAAVATVEGPAGGAPVGGVANPAPPPASIEGPTWVVERGDNLWERAEHEVAEQTGRPIEGLRAAEVAPHWRDLVERFRGELPGRDPNLIFPGEHLPAGVEVVEPAVPAAPVTPAAAEPAEPAQEATHETAPPATAAPTTVAQEPAAPPATEATVAESPPATEAPAEPQGATAAQEAEARTGLSKFAWAAGLLGTGIAVLVARRRRRAARHRQPGEAFVPTEAPEVGAVELAVQVGADEPAADWLEAALRAMAAGLAESAGEPPGLVGLVLGERTLGVTMTDEVPAPSPFRSTGSATWSLDRATPADTLLQLAGGRPVPAPALVTLGRIPEGGEVLVDLEDAGLLSLDGPGAREVAVAAGFQLATTTWDTPAEVVLVGFESPPDAPYCSTADTLEEALDRLEHRATATALAITDAGCRSTMEARCRGRAKDHWIPAVVVCPDPPDETLARRLVGLVSSAEAAGIAAIVGGHVPGSPWELVIGPEGLTVDALGVTVMPQRVSGPAAAAIADLIDAAGRLPEPVETPPLEELARPGEPQWIIDVLGPVGLRGVEKLERPKALEALTYLCLHRDHLVDGDRLIEVLWPDSDPERFGGRLNTTLWSMRQVLGYDETGDCPGLPKLPGGARHYRAGEVVATTLEVLRGALEEARRAEPERVRELLEPALGYVRGEPFDTGGQGYRWAHAGLSRDAQVVIAEAAHLLCQACLDQGDPQAAWSATVQGLRGCPGDEGLYRDQMRVHAAQGNGAGVAAAYEELVELAEEDDDPIPLDDRTVALYQEFRSGERQEAVG